MDRYKVDGMTCGGCASSVTKALQAVEPDAKVNIDLESGTVSVTGIDATKVEQVIEAAGFDFGGTV